MLAPNAELRLLIQRVSQKKTLYEELNESSHLLFGEKHHAQKKKFCAWHTWQWVESSNSMYNSCFSPMRV